MPWNKDGTRKKSAFYLRSGNTTSFKEMGASPLKQDGPNIRKGYGKVNSNSWLTEHGKKLLAKKGDFNFLVEKSQQSTKMPKDFNIKGDPSKTPKFDATKMAKSIAKKPTGIASRTIGHAAKTFARGALGITGAAASLLYEFGKESIKRKKAGKSGFNIPKPKKNKGFNF